MVVFGAALESVRATRSRFLSSAELRAPPRRGRRKAAAATGKSSVDGVGDAAVRAWAAANGMTVSLRGRSTDEVEAYRATGNSLTSATDKDPGPGLPSGRSHGEQMGPASARRAQNPPRTGLSSPTRRPPRGATWCPDGHVHGRPGRFTDDRTTRLTCGDEPLVTTASAPKPLWE